MRSPVASSTGLRVPYKRHVNDVKGKIDIVDMACPTAALAQQYRLGAGSHTSDSTVSAAAYPSDTMLLTGVRVAITIHDIANRAGVSIKTVSRVLNGEPHVRPAMRKKVQAVIDELEYRPNAFARSLSSSKTYVIGLFAEFPLWSYYISEMQRHALLHCRSKGYHLIFEPVDLTGSDWANSLRTLHGRLKLDGAILLPPISDCLPFIEDLENLDVPYVRVSPGGIEARSGLVGIEEAGAARRMTEHLLSLGHRKIAFIGGPSAHLAASARRRGFLNAMTNAGMAVPADHLADGDFSFSGGFEIASRMMGTDERPTAIFAANDDMALGVSAAAARYGLRVPDDLSIAGFDDTPSARACWPAITTVRQPIDRMALAAADIIMNGSYRSDLSNPEFRVRLECELVLRESTAPLHF